MLETKHHTKKDVPTIHISLRIPEYVMASLESESTQCGISVNAMASRILSRWSRWDRHAENLGMVLIPLEMVTMLTQNSNENDITRVVDKIFPFFQDTVVLIKGKYDLKRSIETLEDYMQTMNIISTHTVENNAHYFIIRHKLGIYWSIFIKMFLNKLFTKFVPDNRVDYTVQENIITVKALLGSDWDEHSY